MENNKISYFLHYFLRILFPQTKRILFMNTSSLIMKRHWLLLPQFLTSTSHLFCLQSYPLHSQFVALYIYICVCVCVYIYIYMLTYVYISVDNCIYIHIYGYKISVSLHILQWSSLYRKQFLMWTSHIH